MATHHSYSPYSSAGNLDSINGTPSTYITSFSNDDAQMRPDTDSGPALSKDEHNDPFVVVPKRSKDRLSATALPFNPAVNFSPVLSVQSTFETPESSPTSVYDFIIGDAFPRVSEVDVSEFGTFTTATGASRSIKVNKIYTASAKDVAPAIMTTLENLKKYYKLKGQIRLIHFGDSEYLHLNHIEDAQVVYNTIKKEHLEYNALYITSAQFGSIASPAAKNKYRAFEGQVYLEVTYPQTLPSARIRFQNAMRAILAVDGELCAWKRLNPLNADRLRFVVEFADASLADACVKRCTQASKNTLIGKWDGFVAHYDPTGVSNDQNSSTSSPPGSVSVAAILDEKVSELNLETPDSQNSRSARATAAPAIVNDSPVCQGMSHIPIYSPPPMGSFRHHFTNARQGSPGMFTPMSTGSPYTPARYHYGYDHQFNPLRDYSPTYTSTPYQNRYGGSDDRSFIRSNGSHQSIMSPVRNRGGLNSAQMYNGPNPNNSVDIGRIQVGIDVRTTVMLRNIPNKVNQAELKQILDQSSFGKFDFAYLRIDFSNDCNVGYAFINFADPLDIIPFVEAHAGKRWTTIKSDKVAEVSYATIQGRDCLIQKFRNSSVMLEAPHYRPKLFYTLEAGELAGTEENFPSSDNPSKLMRSCQNAESVGLFPPAAGQYVRDEMRRRHSQFDRGTTLADRDEHDFKGGHNRAGSQKKTYF